MERKKSGKTERDYSYKEIIYRIFRLTHFFKIIIRLLALISQQKYY